MKVLFLDDDYVRHDAFNESLQGCTSEIWHVYSAEDAIKRMRERKFNLICLDFDLGTGCSQGSAVVVSIDGLKPITL